MKKLLLTGLALALSALPALASNPITLKESLTTPKNITVTGTGTLTLPASAVMPVKMITKGLSPNTGAAVNSTLYRALIFPGQAGTVVGVTFGCQVAPIGGTDTLKVLKASASGSTMLSTASVDATTLVAYTGLAGVLTATGANLAVTATQPIYVEYNQGTTSTAAQSVEVNILFRPTAP